MRVRARACACDYRAASKLTPLPVGRLAMLQWVIRRLLQLLREWWRDIGLCRSAVVSGEDKESVVPHAFECDDVIRRERASAVTESSRLLHRENTAGMLPRF